MHDVRASHFRDFGNSREEFEILSLEARTLFHAVYSNLPPSLLYSLFPGQDTEIYSPKENCSVVGRNLLDCISVYVLENW